MVKLALVYMYSIHEEKIPSVCRELLHSGDEQSACERGRAASVQVAIPV